MGQNEKIGQNEKMGQKERMLAELPYLASDAVLSQERLECKRKIYELNHVHPDQYARIPGLLKELFGKTGDALFVEPPFYCDYGYNIEVGEGFYANYNCTILDVAKVKIGKNVLLAPNVSIYTAGHPMHPQSRNSGYEYGISITIGDNVWIGGGTVILPGVTIGSNAVIGAGSVVSKDIPDWVAVAGNPCKAIRKITEEDRKYYFKDRVFDVEI